MISLILDAHTMDRVTPRYVRKLYQEIAIMRELDHPHIVKLR